MAKKRDMREEELELAESAAPAVEAEEKVDFDVWHAMRQGKIPAIHHKEIIKADFRGRGLKHFESLSDFDAALKKYGIKLD